MLYAGQDRANYEDDGDEDILGRFFPAALHLAFDYYARGMSDDMHDRVFYSTFQVMPLLMFNSRLAMKSSPQSSP
ncbi:hypothetical protein NUU61_005166 [Penicillium alfredii]|uniref:Uncharacterized protein n=1 Tax=Penicillium alfredii TaxID=1506179 RepID=A0A9W9F8W1_9EURO|nr:uncharacterized protein NUU61_005166 [Penicillium alfredii]KAJ5095810.1 hypothetical protein NUU61_005166 [Penicillium alfredii]